MKSNLTIETFPNERAADCIRFGFETGSKAEYVAAGKKLRRWQWLRTPEPEDARLIRKFDADNRNGGVDLVAYHALLGRLVKEGYIKMEELS